MEIHALNNSFYDLERSGAHFVASPHHDADLLPVTGPVSRQTQHALRTAYECTPGPKRVVAVGTCAKRRRIRRAQASSGPVAKVLPVDAVIWGCPPAPMDRRRGLLGLIRA